MNITYISYKKYNAVHISICLENTTTQIANFEVARIGEFFDQIQDGTIMKTGNAILQDVKCENIEDKMEQKRG